MIEQDGQATYEGATLRTVHVYLGDGDYVDYAEVWDGAALKQVRIEDSRGYSTKWTIDATPEVIEAARQYAATNQFLPHLVDLGFQVGETAGYFRYRLDRGAMVTVVAGRKPALGTTGRIFWVGEDQFSGGVRVGLEINSTGEKMFVNAYTGANDRFEVAPTMTHEEAWEEAVRGKVLEKLGVKFTEDDLRGVAYEMAARRYQ